MASGGALENGGKAALGLLGRLTRRRAGAEAAAVAAALRSDRFRLEREADWQRLEAIVGRIERGRLRGLADADLLALPALYRTVASSLSVARETSLDAATLAYLEALVSRAWFIVYGPRISFGQWCARFFGGGWSRAVRALAPDIAFAVIIMLAGGCAGWAAVAADASWYGAIVPGAFMDERRPGASREALRGVLFNQTHQDMLPAFAAALFSNNAAVAILCFALGFLFGIPSLLLLAQNGGIVGAMLWLYHGQGLTLDLVAWLSIHGTTELSAIVLAGAAGLHIGRAIAFPGSRAVVDAAAAAGQRAAPVMLGAVLMLVIAALLEGIGRQTINTTGARLIVGWGMLGLWLAYFTLLGRRAA